MFPNSVGTMYSQCGEIVQAFLKAGRVAGGTPHMTFRHCRTTFATLYEGDPRDRQAILGHHSEEFTARVYQKPIQDRQKASVEGLDGALDRQGSHDASTGNRLNFFPSCPNGY